MRLTTRKLGKIVVLECAGKMTTGEPSTLLKGTFREQLDRGETRFIFNMARVPWLDSGAIGEVVACRGRAAQAGGVIRLVLSGRSHDLFTLMRLHRVFDIFPTLEEALASLVDWSPEKEQAARRQEEAAPAVALQAG